MKKFVSAVLSLFILLSFSSCSQNTQQRFSRDFLDLFDTASFITAVDISNESFENHFNLVYEELKTYSQLYDIYNSYGDLVNLKYINENAADSPVKADQKIIDLLLWGKEAYEISGGRVNIAMGSVLSVWHDAREYGIENPDSAYLPDMETLEEMAQHTDIEDLIINEEDSTVYFADDQMRLDVGAIAKGYVCERICSFITQNSVWDSALIDLGGNVKSLGYRDANGKTPFAIGIENPDGGYIDIVNASNGTTVVTSGDYQRYYTVNGKQYCHIISAETLMPAEGIRSVTVISDDSALADVLSTTLFQMSVKDGMALIENTQNAEAVWLDTNGDISRSSGYGEFAQ